MLKCFKSVVCLLFLMVIGIWGCRAQDTIYLQDIQQIDRYGFAPWWPKYPDDYMVRADGKSYYIALRGVMANNVDFGAYAYSMFTEDTVTIYGVAAPITHYVYYTDDYPEFNENVDTSAEYSYAWLMLYEAESDSLRQMVDTAPMYVHVWQRPTYYLSLDLWQLGSWPERKVQVLPMYERYFLHPVEVTDSFYVGLVLQTERNYARSQGSGLCILDFSSWDTTRVQCAYLCNDGDVWGYFTRRGSRMMFFPILTPPDTNSGSGYGGSDSLGVQGWDLVSRYTNVMPNPASNTVRILSSFGINAIEAFDAAGRCVFRTETHGLAGTLDVAAWPRGTYLLHITTNSGTAVKKLILQ